MADPLLAAKERRQRGGGDDAAAAAKRREEESEDAEETDSELRIDGSGGAVQGDSGVYSGAAEESESDADGGGCVGDAFR